MRNRWKVQRAHGKFYPVVGAGLAHQAAHVGLHGSLLNAQLAGDLAIRSGHQNMFQHLALAIGQVRAGANEACIRDFEQPVNQFESSRRGAQIDPPVTTSMARRTISGPAVNSR